MGLKTKSRKIKKVTLTKSIGGAVVRITVGELQRGWSFANEAAGRLFIQDLKDPVFARDIADQIIMG